MGERIFSIIVRFFYTIFTSKHVKIQWKNAEKIVIFMMMKRWNDEQCKQI